VLGGENTDIIFGGKGDDKLYATTDNPEYLTTAADSGDCGDWLSGEGGNDTLIGSRKQDVLFGGAGIDIINGGAGNDLILGDGQYAISTGSTALPDSSITLAYVWNTALGGFNTSALSSGDYSINSILVVNGNASNDDDLRLAA
jgi:Ca2+-binding RTX toxin-like protein